VQQTNTKFILRKKKNTKLASRIPILPSAHLPIYQCLQPPPPRRRLGAKSALAAAHRHLGGGHRRRHRRRRGWSCWRRYCRRRRMRWWRGRTTAMSAANNAAPGNDRRSCCYVINVIKDITWSAWDRLLLGFRLARGFATSALEMARDV